MKRGPLLGTSVSSPQLVCGLHGGGSESTDTDRLTALLYFYMGACKCQLFTDEGSRRLPKRLNYCFSVSDIRLASATNRSILMKMCQKVYDSTL